MFKLVLAAIGIIAIFVVSNIIRGFIANKTGYSGGNRTRLGDAVNDVSRQAFRANDLRKQIYAKRDSFRGLPVIENAIAKIFSDTDPSHLPAKIMLNVSGAYIIPYDASIGKYNPMWVQKLGEGDLPTFDYMNGCAFFLLIQEKYPEMYDFENTKVDDVDYGNVEQIVLHLKSARNLAVW